MWYVNIDGNTFGPYYVEQLYEMINMGQITADTLVYRDEDGVWRRAGECSELFSWGGENQFGQSTVNQGVYQYQTGQTNVAPKRKKSGCLRGCFVVLLVVFGIFVGLYFVVQKLNQPNTIHKGDEQMVYKGTFTEEGGSILIEDSNSEISGFGIEIPENAYQDKTKFKVSTIAIDSHEFGENFEPITPIIHVDNGGVFANEALTVTIPISIRDDEFAMAFYYTKEGTLEALPLLYEDTTKMIVSTKHFSEIVGTKIKKDELKNIDIDTGFRPKIDDWPFTNYGSQAAQGGFCAGQTVSMAYYYFEKKLKGEENLVTRYDNNHEAINTPGFEYDDSLGIRLSSTIQRELNFSGYYFDITKRYMNKSKYVTDEMLYMAFAYAMLLTNDPQLMGIYVRSEVPDKDPKLEHGHAILVYRITNDRLYVADPNFPGNTELSIPYNNNVLGPYVSKTSADKPDTLYNSFCILSKSALIDWQHVGDLFTEIEKSPQKSTIGNKIFGGANYYVVTDYKDNKVVYTTNPETIELDEVTKNTIKQALKDEPSFPADWMTKDYLVASVNAGVINKGAVIAYRGTDKISQAIFNQNQSQFIFIPLDKGVNNIGLGYFDFKTVQENNQTTTIADYMQFYRLNVKNGEADLTGSWSGSFQIKEAEHVKNVAQSIGEMITKPLMYMISESFDVPMPTDEEIKAAVESSIEVNEEAFLPMDMNVEFEKIDDKNYKASVTMTTDIDYSYETKASYDNGEVKLKIQSDDGAEFEFTYYLYDNKTLAGTFKVKAYGSTSAVSGDCSLER